MKHVYRYEGFSVNAADGVGQESVWRDLRQQIYLGDDAFVERMQEQISAADEMTVPKAQRRAPPRPLAVIAERAASRDEAIVAAYATGAYSYPEIGE